MNIGTSLYTVDTGVKRLLKVDGRHFASMFGQFAVVVAVVFASLSFASHTDWTEPSSGSADPVVTTLTC